MPKKCRDRLYESPGRSRHAGRQSTASCASVATDTRGHALWSNLSKSSDRVALRVRHLQAVHAMTTPPDETLETRLRKAGLDLSRGFLFGPEGKLCADAADMIAALRQQLADAQGELRNIDNLMARRPALDRATRYDNIAKAIQWAGKADAAERAKDAAKARVSTLEQQLADRQPEVSYSTTDDACYHPAVRDRRRAGRLP